VLNHTYLAGRTEPPVHAGGFFIKRNAPAHERARESLICPPALATIVRTSRVGAAGFSELFGGGRAVAVAAKPTPNPIIANMRAFLFIAEIKMQWRDFRSCRGSDGEVFFGGIQETAPALCGLGPLVGHASFHVPERGDPRHDSRNTPFLKMFPAFAGARPAVFSCGCQRQ
jgi:hypothetical protein